MFYQWSNFTFLNTIVDSKNVENILGMWWFLNYILINEIFIIIISIFEDKIFILELLDFHVNGISCILRKLVFGLGVRVEVEQVDVIN